MSSFNTGSKEVRNLRAKISASTRWGGKEEDRVAWRAQIQELELKEHIEHVGRLLSQEARHRVAKILLDDGWTIAKVVLIDGDGHG